MKLVLSSGKEISIPMPSKLSKAQTISFLKAIGYMAVAIAITLLVVFITKIDQLAAIMPAINAIEVFVVKLFTSEAVNSSSNLPTDMQEMIEESKEIIDNGNVVG